MLGIGGHNCFHTVAEAVSAKIQRPTLAAQSAKHQAHIKCPPFSTAAAVRRMVPFVSFGLFVVLIMKRE